ncbi:SH3 domain-containing protein [Telmatospirillum sp.]|uniref:SH3 domain-containing protein n=1 Tax=Telmatospirillum sp. TaxID=2079197 RepID=UPI00284ED1D5|nr:SH3 domain-containing protein [Telmatospirillum sp.]MDR3436198.1 SH3 domain-containing protein [Telmatospirillum sp.]
MKPYVGSYRLGLALAACLLSSSAFAAEAVAIGSATLRAGPGEEYPSIGSVSSGEVLDVLGCLDRHDWCDVSAEGERGWFSGSRIAFVRGSERFALAEHYDEFRSPVVVFSLNEYWGSHYESRPWFSDDKWRHGKDALPADWKRTHNQDAVPKEPVAGQPKPQPAVIAPSKQETKAAVEKPAAVAPTKQETKAPIDKPAAQQDTKPAEKMTEPANKPAAQTPPPKDAAAKPKDAKTPTEPCKAPGQC